MIPLILPLRPFALHDITCASGGNLCWHMDTSRRSAGQAPGSLPEKTGTCKLFHRPDRGIPKVESCPCLWYARGRRNVFGATYIVSRQRVQEPVTPIILPECAALAAIWRPRQER